MTAAGALPLVSVIVPVYQGAACVGRALDALAAQTLAPQLEILVVDDASSDDSAGVVRAWQRRHPGIALTLIGMARNQGPGVARNKALAQARAPYVAFLDADDTCVPHRIEHQVRVLEAEPALGCVGSWYRMLGAGGQILAERRPRLAPVDMAWLSLVHSPFLLSTLVTRRALCGETLFPARYKGEDGPAQRGLLWQAPGAFVEEVLVGYQTVPGRACDPRMAQALAEDLAPLIGSLSPAEAWEVMEAVLAFPHTVSARTIPVVRRVLALGCAFRRVRPAWVSRDQASAVYDRLLDLAAPFIDEGGAALFD
ncbi:glycosyltransferase family 2 protein [Pararhodospirillum oryzae]|uniref:Glycosyl transferase n=1 Tax=Pararhodospirillum oryzae TaxID=478448 RepID=A0A512H5Z2_9PROT|nr:glycosyltransferase family 2 protein [Pararhodospirillum oryzae]GEO80848.1 glycosyl transferase [Pararhodospirillum oryzae]